MEDILKNEEINTMIHTIGAGSGSDFVPSDIQYDKVIIMTDADDDGAHIQVLLLTFFYRFMRPLIELGKLYIAMPPLYKVTSGKSTSYAYDNDELKELTEGKKCRNTTLQRARGNELRSTMGNNHESPYQIAYKSKHRRCLSSRKKSKRSNGR